MWRDHFKRGASSAGFTLIELLVALSMLALMSVFTYRAVSSALDAEVHVKRISSQWLNLATFFDQFERDAMQAISRPIRDRGGNTQPALILRANGTTDNQPDIEWTRLGEALTQDAASRRIGYRLHDGKLQYVQWSVLDRAPATEMQSITLEEKIQAFHLRCMTRDGRWIKNWPENGLSNDLPRALEVTVVLENGASVVRLFLLGSA